jgi:protein TonB
MTKRITILWIAATLALALAGCRGSREEAPGAAFDAFDEPPLLVSEAKPMYPEEARREGREGMVWVKVLIGADGVVEEAKAVRSTDSVFEESAVSAAAMLRFEPAKLRGEPTKSRILVPIQFRLD